ncbi:MAG: hypothetical protein PHP85_12740 [Gallionella sp.]|nr:hypothetical protein [Gallionella sp.]
MSKKYERTSTTLFVSRIMREVKYLAAELHEHRYYLERNVERRTAQLQKRIEILESCNANLCRNLALSQRELAAMQYLHTTGGTETDNAPAKLYILKTGEQIKHAAVA